MSYLEELLPEFRQGAKIRIKDWDSNRYIYFCNGCVFSADDNMVFLPSEYLNSNNWEFYIEPIDWDYIIKNKCLCWFWDNESNIPQSANYLKEIRKDLTYSFITNSEHGWKYCRPVRRDEVTFYEDL